MVDEAMRLLNPCGKATVEVCHCALSRLLAAVKSAVTTGQPAGMVRFDCRLNGQRRSVLMNAAYFLKQHGFREASVS